MPIDKSAPPREMTSPQTKGASSRQPRGVSSPFFTRGKKPSNPDTKVTPL